MIAPDALSPQFVTDADGRRTAVLLPIEVYEELLDDLDDLAVAARRADEPTVPHAEVVGERPSGS